MRLRLLWAEWSDLDFLSDCRASIHVPWVSNGQHAFLLCRGGVIELPAKLAVCPRMSHGDFAIEPFSDPPSHCLLLC